MTDDPAADDNARLRRLMQRELEDARSTLTRLAADAAQTEAEFQALGARLARRDAQYEERLEEVAALTSELSATKRLLEDAQRRLAATEAQRDTLQAKVNTDASKLRALPGRAVRKARRVLGERLSGGSGT